jgi:alpha-galactosidase
MRKWTVLVATVCGAVSAWSATVSEKQGTVTMDNGSIALAVTLADGRWNGTFDGVPVFEGLAGGFSSGGTTLGGFTGYTKNNVADAFGSGVEATFALKAGGKLVLRLYDGEELFIVRLMRDGATGVATFSGTFKSGVPRKVAVWFQDADFSVLKHRPLVQPLGDRTIKSAFSAAAWDGYDRPGLFVGSVGIEAREQTVQIAPNPAGLTFSAWSDLDEKGSGQPFAVFATRRLTQRMERYAELVKALNGIVLTDWIPCGWCTWDSFEDAVTQEDVLMGANFIAKNLRDYGFNLVQVDDGWQKGWRCSAQWEANDKFPKGMKWLAEELHKRGLTAGIWAGPFCDEDNYTKWNDTTWGIQYPHFSEPPANPGPKEEYLQKFKLNKPEVLSWLKDQLKRYTHEWGYDYVKVDFLYNSDATPMEFRTAVKAMKDAMKPGTYLLNCNSYPWRVIGAGDGMRLGEDVKGNFNLSKPDYSIVSAIRGAAYQWYANGKLWIGDADQLHVVDPLTAGQARIWATLVGLSGGVVLTGDKVWEIPKDRLDMMKAVVPAYGVAARPVDMFERYEQFPNVYVLPVPKSWSQDVVVAVMNWDTIPLKKSVDLALHLEVPADRRYHAYEFWTGKYLGVFSGVLDVAVPGHDVACVNLVPVQEGRPQVISTGRHITQGGVDLESVSWDESAKTLNGRSKTLVAKVPYTITLAMPSGMAVSDAVADGKNKMRVGKPSSDGTVTVTLVPQAATSSWTVSFK